MKTRSKNPRWDIHPDRYFHNVKSTNLRRVYWSRKYRTLVVEFMSDNTTLWLYPEVSQGLFINLLKAESKGKYFARYIRDTHQAFPCAIQMPEETPSIDLIVQLLDSIKMVNERREQAS